MYKSKIGVWIFVLIVANIIFNFSTISTGVKNFFKGDPDINIKVEDNNGMLKNQIKRHGDLKYLDFNLVEMNQDVTLRKITDPSQSEMYIYSPLVMYIYTNNTSDFETNADEKYVKDLSVILEAMLNDKDWKDIGFKKFKGKVTLMIPNERSIYYQDIIDLFLINLYDTPTTDENKAERMKTVSILLDKCEKIENIDTYDENIDTILIAPEYADSNLVNDTTVYPTLSCNIYYEVVANESSKDLVVKTLKKDNNVWYNFDVRNNLSTDEYPVIQTVIVDDFSISKSDFSNEKNTSDVENKADEDVEIEEATEDVDDDSTEQAQTSDDAQEEEGKFPLILVILGVIIFICLLGMVFVGISY